MSRREAEPQVSGFVPTVADPEARGDSRSPEPGAALDPRELVDGGALKPTTRVPARTREDSAPDSGPSPTPPSSARFEPGARIGRFVLVDVLGEGGMGIVYLAHDPELDRKLAIKSLRGEAWAASPKTRDRLNREAQAMAQLDHPNVVTVYDMGFHDGQMFVAMAFVEGRDLRAWLQAKERELDDILKVFEDAGRGLAAAHERGLVHRDFKPDNVLIDREGKARVADFGLARQLHAPTGDEQAPTQKPFLAATLTQTGSLMGTPPYMAPELYLGGRGDSKSDQFAFCVALFEAVYGARPFAGRTLEAVSEAILSGELRELDPGDPKTKRAPARLHALILRGLARERGDRFRSMEALLAELADIRRELRGEGGRRRRPGLAVLGTLAVLTAAGVAAVYTGLADPIVAELGQRFGLPLASSTVGPVHVQSAAAGQGWRALEAGRPTTALAELEAADPEDEQATLVRALARLELGEVEAAQDLLDRLDTLAEQPAAIVGRARIAAAEDRGDPAKALARLEQLRASLEDDGAALPWRFELARAELLLAQGEEQRAATLLGELREGPAPARAELLLAGLTKSNQHDAAHAHLLAAVEATPVGEDPRYGKARADFLLAAGCRASAREALIELAEIDGALDAAALARLAALELGRLEDARLWQLEAEPAPELEAWIAAAEAAGLDERRASLLRARLALLADDPKDATLAPTRAALEALGADDLDARLLLARLDHGLHRYERAYATLDEAYARADGPREQARVLELRGRLQADDEDFAEAADTLSQAWARAQRARIDDPGWLIALADLSARYQRHGANDRDFVARRIARPLTRRFEHHAGAWTLLANTVGDDSAAEAKRAQQRAEAQSWCR